MTLQRGNAVGDALRHRSTPHRILRIGGRAHGVLIVTCSLRTRGIKGFVCVYGVSVDTFSTIIRPFREQVRSHGLRPESKADLYRVMAA
ncbi:DUF1534 domain-containing protein [Pseudomonas syringae]|nr:DUF1534 domain-containing protein [Pseudomonas syringae]